jgi:hypothetical protein
MTVEYRLDGPVAVITIDRYRRRNAIDLATAEALGAAWRRFEADPDASVGVLHGANGVFSSGADLVAFDLEDRPDGFLGFTRTRVSKPTIAAVAGYCVAGGLELALWCDLRVAGADAVFGCFERRWGVPLVDGGTQRLPCLIGLSRAMDIILTGRAVDATEAHEILSERFARIAPRCWTGSDDRSMKVSTSSDGTESRFFPLPLRVPPRSPPGQGVMDLRSKRSSTDSGPDQADLRSLGEIGSAARSTNCSNWRSERTSSTRSAALRYAVMIESPVSQ